MITVTFAGTNYLVPESGDESWPQLTDYLVALSTAATTLSMNYSARVATTSPQSILPTDTIVMMNVGSASSAVLLAGIPGQFIGVYDFSGAADINPITVTGSSDQKINGDSSYIIRSAYGGLLMQFNGVFWQIIAESSLDVLLRTVYRTNDGTNSSLIEGGVVALSSFPSVANLKTCSFALTLTNFYRFYISISDGTALCCTGNYASADISSPADPSGIFLSADSGTGIYVHKSATSNVINVKNRTGGSVAIEIHTESGKIASVINWA